MTERQMRAQLQRSASRLLTTNASTSASAILLTILLVPSFVTAGYSSMCAYHAGELERAARNYESVKSDFESEQSRVRNACSSYGYYKNDEEACGQFGYIRTAYKNAADELENAADQLKSAISNVGSSCGVPDENQKLVKSVRESEALKKQIGQLEKELEQYRRESRPPESTPSLDK